MSAQPISDQLAMISATVNQAEQIIELAADNEDKMTHVGAIYGTATVLRFAMTDLGKIAVEMRRNGN